MKKINTKIVLAITICCLFASAVIGSISLVKGKSAVKIEAEDKLIEKTKNQANILNKNFAKVESSASSIEALVCRW